MLSLLLAVFIYTVVFGADYLFYVKQKGTYNYVSRRTVAVFLLGQLAIIVLFFNDLQPYFKHLYAEIFYLSALSAVLLAFTFTIVKERLLVCHLTSRTERCLTPGYVLVKGTEIVFQQLSYLVIALTLVKLLGFTMLTFIAFIQILLIMHTPVILSCNRQILSRLTFGLAIISAPILYVFIEFSYFFPAVYLHSLLYIFYWVSFADFNPNLSQRVDK